MFGTPISKEYLVQLDPQSHAHQFIVRGQQMLAESERFVFDASGYGGGY